MHASDWNSTAVVQVHNTDLTIKRAKSVAHCRLEHALQRTSQIKGYDGVFVHSLERI